MNDLTITPELIRRFPFAVNPSRISDADEIFIAADMIVRRNTERYGQPPTKRPKREEYCEPILAGEDTHEGRKALRRKGQDRRTAIVKAIGVGCLPVSVIHSRLSPKYQTTCANLAQFLMIMESEGLVERELRSEGQTRANYWSRRSGGRT